MGNNLKKISFEEFILLKGERSVYAHIHGDASSKEVFYSNLKTVNMDSRRAGSYEIHYLVTKFPMDFVEKVITSGENCAKETLLSEFEQGKTYWFKVGDPYEFMGKIEGILVLEQEEYLMIRTSWDDFLICCIDEGLSVRLLEIKRKIV